MNINEILRQKQELYEKLYPPSARRWEAIKRSLNPGVRQQNLHKALVPLSKSYFDLMGIMDGTMPSSQVSAGPVELLFFDYDFLDLAAIEQNDDSQDIIVYETTRISSIIADIYNDNLIVQTISPREFEEIVTELLAALGFKVEMTLQTKDGGYDIIAIKQLGMLNPLKFLVECKKQTQCKVDVKIIRGFKNVIDTENANRGIIVATAYFAKGVTEKGNETPYLLEFKDKDDVMDWVEFYAKNRRGV